MSTNHASVPAIPKTSSAAPSKPSSSGQQLAVISGEVALATREERQVSARLQPARWEDAGPVLVPLFRLGSKRQDLTAQEAADEARMRVADFQLTCAGEPLWAIKETVAAFVTGRAGKGFCPNSAEFGAALRATTSIEREKLTRARRALREAQELAELNAPQGPMSEETRRFVNENVARWKSAAAEARNAPVPMAPRGPSPAARVAEEAAMLARQAEAKRGRA